MEQNLKNIEEFFKLNLKIKNILLNCAPNPEDNYNNNSVIKYGDKLYFELLDLNSYFIKMCEILNLGSLNKYIDNLFKKYQKDLLNSGYSYSKLKKFFYNE